MTGERALERAGERALERAGERALERAGGQDSSNVAARGPWRCRGLHVMCRLSGSPLAGTFLDCTVESGKLQAYHVLDSM
jgi:hypothetical protein